MTFFKHYPALQFSFFRIVFGLYLFIHYAFLLPYAAEIYSNSGVLPDAGANPTFSIFPSPFWINDSALTAQIIVLLCTLLSLAFTLGFQRRSSALGLWYLSACLFNRNVLTSNPSLAYIGLLLLLCVLIPNSEPVSLRKSEKGDWFMPGMVFYTAWILMAAGYTISGLIKLQSPSWVDGSALHHLAMNPLARPGLFRDIILSMPEIFLKLLTWSTLVFEILFLPLSLFRSGRLFAWVSMVFLHLGILLVVDFADLTAGMLVLHLFTLDPEWLMKKPDGKKRIVFFDGDCGFCNSSVQTLLSFDRQGLYSFSPLQGKTASTMLPAELREPSSLDTIVLAEESEGKITVQTHSNAILAILSNLGGLCRLISFSKILPEKLRNIVYNLIARNRKLISKKLSCAIPTEEEQARFLE